MHCSLSTTGGSENDVTVTTHVNSKQRFYHNYLFPRIDSGDEDLFTTRNLGDETGVCESRIRLRFTPFITRLPLRVREAFSAKKFVLFFLIV